MSSGDNIELRDAIMQIVRECLWDDPDGASEEFEGNVADRILALPEIAEALRSARAKAATEARWHENRAPLPYHPPK